LSVTSDDYEQVKKPAEDRCLWNKKPNGTMEAKELLSQWNTSRRSQISEV